MPEKIRITWYISQSWNHPKGDLKKAVLNIHNFVWPKKTKFPGKTWSPPSKLQHIDGKRQTFQRNPFGPHPLSSFAHPSRSRLKPSWNLPPWCEGDSVDICFSGLSPKRHHQELPRSWLVRGKFAGTQVIWVFPKVEGYPRRKLVSTRNASNSWWSGGPTCLLWGKRASYEFPHQQSNSHQCLRSGIWICLEMTQGNLRPCWHLQLHWQASASSHNAGIHKRVIA